MSQWRRPAPVVAIDGPAGAGKSTVSRRVAEELGYTLLDTGALYRCVGLKANELGVADRPIEVERVARELAVQHAIRFKPDGAGGQIVLLAGTDVTSAIRTAEVSTLASKVSAIAEVRAALLQIQRDVGNEGRVVVEGRDIGTVVFPDAEAKFFLTANVEQRAARRYAELQQRDPETSLTAVLKDVHERDHRDSSRPVAPLLQASDAVLVDSTTQTIDQVVGTIVRRVRQIAAEMERG
jgi:cytidylate kinase